MRIQNIFAPSDKHQRGGFIVIYRCFAFSRSSLFTALFWSLLSTRKTFRAVRGTLEVKEEEESKIIEKFLFLNLALVIESSGERVRKG